MSFCGAMFILAIAFVVHNFEEWLGFDHFREVFLGRLDTRLKDHFVFGAALVFLSAAVLGVTLFECVFDMTLVHCLSRISVLEIGLNALWHCGLSLYRRQLVPGTLSALFLLVPLAATATCLMFHMGDTAFEFGLYVVISVLLLPVFVYSSLWAGYAAKWLLAKVR